MILIALAVPIFFILMAVEVVVGRRQHRRVYQGRDTIADLLMGLGNRVIELGWVIVEVAILAALYRWSPFDLGRSWLGWTVAIVGLDLMYYAYHRAHHEIRVLWAVHVLHHSSQRYNLAVALRQPWVVLSWTPFLAPLALAGIRPEMLATAYAINLLYQFWIHTELIGKLGPVEWIFNTPSHHRVHHGKNPQYLDRNYAGILIVWDRLFRSFEPEGETVIFGLTKDIATFNPLRIATHEFASIWRDVRAATSWRARFGHTFRNPGWQPAAASTEVTAPETALV